MAKNQVFFDIKQKGMISVDLYVFDDEKSFERSNKATWTTEIPFWPFLAIFANILAKFIFFIVRYYVMTGVDSYHFGDENSIRSGFKAIELPQNNFWLLLTNFGHLGC